MNETKILQRSIDDLLPDLPRLIGGEWPDFEAQLDDLLDRLRSDPSRRSILRAQTLALFGRFPQAHQRLVEQMARYRGSSDITRSARNWARGMVTRYTDITCPRRIWAETPRAAIVVRLTVQRPELSAAIEELGLFEHLPVQVHLEAPQFEILNESRQEVLIEREKDSSPIVFYVRPRRTGHVQVTLDFFQAGQPLRSVPLDVEVTPYEIAADVAKPRMQPVHLEKDVNPPDRVLHIAWERPISALRFTLIQNGGAWWRSFKPVEIHGDPAAHAAELYRQIVKYAAGEDPAMAAVHKRRSSMPRQDVDEQIRALGHNLWRDLVPPELKQLYEQHRKEWRSGSLLVYSDEPHLPWELVWPHDDAAGEWEDRTPWCHRLRLTRWLRKDERDNGNEMAPPRLGLGTMAVIAPTYSRFASTPSAQSEHKALLELMERFGVRDVTPGEAKWADFRRFLKGGGYDWVHLAAHGNFYPQGPEGLSVLWMQQDDAFMPQHLTGPSIVRHFRQRRPAFFLNACQTGRQSWAFTKIGGWANRLVSLGAGLFVAPLWNVTGESALTFANAFYEEILDGKTVADAARSARSAARKSGDPTWLAYSVYGHPNAKAVLREGGQP